MSLVKEYYWEQNYPLVRVNGLGSREFLNGQTTANIKSANEDIIFGSCWLNSSGRLLAILGVRLDTSGADVVILSGNSHIFRENLESISFPADKVDIGPVTSIRQIEIFGVNNAERFKNLIWLSDSDSLPEELNNMKRATEIEFKQWSVTRGFPLTLNELDSDLNPFELGLYDLVSLDKGCYLGQEKIAKLLRSGESRYKLRCWESESKVLVGDKLSIYGDQSKKNVGKIISSTKIYSSNKQIGLAIIAKKAFNESHLIIGRSLTKVQFKEPWGCVYRED